MEESVAQQALDIAEQTKLYKEELTKKMVEEDEMFKVATDYKARFADFDKSLKVSRANLKQYEKEI